MVSHYSVVCVNMNGAGGGRLMMSFLARSVLMAPSPVTNVIHFSSLTLIEVALSSSY